MLAYLWPSGGKVPLEKIGQIPFLADLAKTITVEISVDIANFIKVKTASWLVSPPLYLFSTETNKKDAKRRKMSEKG